MDFVSQFHFEKVVRIEELKVGGKNEFHTVGQNSIPAGTDMIEPIFSRLICFCFGKNEI